MGISLGRNPSPTSQPQALVATGPRPPARNFMPGTSLYSVDDKRLLLSDGQVWRDTNGVLADGAELQPLATVSIQSDGTIAGVAYAQGYGIETLACAHDGIGTYTLSLPSYASTDMAGAVTPSAPGVRASFVAEFVGRTAVVRVYDSGLNLVDADFTVTLRDLRG